MPRQASRLALLALPLALLGVQARSQASEPATAAPLSAAQTASLSRVLLLWTSVPPVYTALPEGDHYRMVLKSGLQGGVIEGGQLTAAARPLDGGRWQFDDIRSSMPIVVSTPAARGQPASQWTLDIQGQGGHCVIDPSLATASTMDNAASGSTGTINAPPNFAAAFRTGKGTTHAIWQPAGPGRIDRSSAVALSDLSVQLTGKQAATLTAADAHGEARFTGFSPDHFLSVMDFLRANLPNATNMHPSGANGGKPASSALTPGDRQAMHAALNEVREVASSFKLEGAMDDVAFSSAGRVVRFRQIGVAQGVSAPGGRLAFTYRATFDGLSSPDIPPAAKDFVPHRFLIAPSISGISIDAVFATLGALIDEGVVDDRKPDALRQTAAGILKKGPVSVGLSALAFDFGPATLAGSGEVTIAGLRPQDVTARATLAAKNFDALVKRASGDPLLHQAAPALIFLKGIGEDDGSGTVEWKVAYAGGRVSVNGTDMTQMLPR